MRWLTAFLPACLVFLPTCDSGNNLTQLEHTNHVMLRAQGINRMAKIKSSWFDTSAYLVEKLDLIAAPAAQAKPRLT